MRRRPHAAIVSAVNTLLLLGALVGYLLVAADGATGAGAAEAGVLVHPPLSVTSVSNDAVASTNWSGYAVQSTAAFTDVVGSWAQPAATCSMLHRTYASFWVGLDGYGSSSVEQVGTDSDCSVSGAPSYYAWWEMYPAGSVTLSTSVYPVEPGDVLTAQVSRSGNLYTLTLHDDDGGPGWTFVATEPGSGANSSAEWVAEAPEVCNVIVCREASLTDFGSVSFAGSTAATGGAEEPVSTFSADGGPHEITMLSTAGLTTRAQPGPLVGGGSGFVDTWNSS